MGVTDEFDVCENAVSVQGKLTATQCNFNGAEDTSIEVGKTAVVDVHNCRLYFASNGNLPERGVSGIAGEKSAGTGNQPSWSDHMQYDIPETASVNRTPIARKMPAWCNDEANWKGWACCVCKRDLLEDTGTLHVFDACDDADVEATRVCDDCWVEPDEDNWYFELWQRSFQNDALKYDAAAKDPAAPASSAERKFADMLTKAAEGHCSSRWPANQWCPPSERNSMVMINLLGKFMKHGFQTVLYDEDRRICDCNMCMNDRCGDDCARCNPR